MKKLAATTSSLILACTCLLITLAAGGAQPSQPAIASPNAPRLASNRISKRIFVKAHEDKNDRDSHPVSMQLQLYDSAEAAAQGFQTTMMIVSIGESRQEELGGTRVHVWDTTMGSGEPRTRFGALLYRIDKDVIQVSWQNKPASPDFVMRVMEAVSEELKAAHESRRLQ